jgi:hypothetical protein
VSKIGGDTHQEYGPHIMTYIVIGICSMALIAACFMPKKFKYIGKKEINLNARQK